MNVIAAAGLTPTNADLTQLLQAMQIVGGQNQEALWHFGHDVGGANALIVDVAPNIANYTDGLIVATIAAANNTGPATINADGRGVVNIKRPDGSPTQAKDILGGQPIVFQYDATGVFFRILVRVIDSKSLVHSGSDTGAPNAIVASVVPPIAEYEIGAQYNIKIGAGNTNTLPATAALSGLPAKSVVHGDGTLLLPGDYVAGQEVIMVYDGTNLQIVSNLASVQKSLAANIIYYVRTDGSNSNTGLANTAGSAWLTLQYAADTVSKINLNGFTVTVNVANGTYTGVDIDTNGGGGRLQFVGNITTPASVVITRANFPAVSVAGGAQVTLNGFKLQSTGASSTDNLAGLFCGNGNVSITNMEFGSCPDAHIIAFNSSAVTMTGAIRISGSSTGGAVHGGGFAVAIRGATIGNPGSNKPDITITTAVTIQDFVYVEAGNIAITYNTLTGAGSVTGKRYNAILNGTINTGGGGASYFPGTVAGTVSTGGQYI